jgi:CheY-like chemotaxis protein
VYASASQATDVIVPPPALDEALTPVLVIEDEIETRLLYEKYLRGTGFQPVPARSIREARVALETVRPAAIILDILLRGEDAWNLLEDLKAAAQTREIPILVVTMVEDRHKALALGANAFCNKPVERRWLLEQLHHLTGRSSPHKVLVIDEEEVSRYLLRQLIPPHWGKVIEAVNGVEGLRFAREEQPRLILLDLLMPYPGGMEVLEQLRADPRTAGIPVVVSSAKTLDAEEQSRLDRQGAAFLSKSALRDGSAAAELRRICRRLGVDGLLEEPARGPVLQ